MKNYELEQSIKQSFIDKNINSDSRYQPILLVNDIQEGKKFLSTLLSELSSCHEFWISVAFVTTSGIAAIINTLLEAQSKGVHGKILVSQYLNFTQPEALRRLSQFKNIDLKISVNESFHSKGYLFRHSEITNIIIGSSNLTQSALTSNKEWNLKISTNEQGLIHEQIKTEFEKAFSSGLLVTPQLINEYEKDWQNLINFNRTIKSTKQHKPITPNKMQIEALKNLADLRVKNKNKALLISATGTGKTYLSAFDVKQFNPKKFLFVVHRLTIAKDALATYRNVFGNQISMGIFSGNQKDLDCDFIFSTVQTISQLEYIKLFKKNHFDYIVIDESHRSSASSYQQILNYFTPSFLLGMTATPERTDGDNIFKLFDYNIAYEIRLHTALAEGMLTPFHYYGITDITINNEIIDNNSDFNKLTSKERINHIINQSQFYSTDSGKIKGLVFCSTNQIASQLASAFQAKGINALALSGSSSEQERAEAIEALDGDNGLEYIFTVDIFNEGIDIPNVNQIILLRPTQSAIIFVQQLGRGLRKSESKEYLTVIDFIGNYENNYLIPIALYGDRSFNKDSLRMMLASGSSMIPGSSTVNFDKISKERIFAAINKANLNKSNDLKNDYFDLKNKLGRIPMMVDFIKYGSRDPWLYVASKKSYFNFISMHEDAIRNKLPQQLIKLLELFTLEINNSKRIEETLLLKLLIEHSSVELGTFEAEIMNNYGYSISADTIESVVRNLNFEFIKQPKRIIRYNEEVFSLDLDLFNALKEEIFKTFLLDTISYAILSFNAKFDIKKFNGGLLRYEKYSRKDVCRLLNWPQDISSTVYGYKTQNFITPCFVTYHKSDNLTGDIDYNDHFINASTFAWESRSKRKLDSSEIKNVINSKRILLFIKKEDNEGIDFYYIGDVSIIPESIKQGVMQSSNAPVVHFTYKIDKAVPDDLYHYLIE